MNCISLCTQKFNIKSSQNNFVSTPACLAKTADADTFVKSKTVTFKKTTKIINESREILRREAARRYGLPESTTWHRIKRTISEIERKKAAIRHGLPESATWPEITGNGLFI
jgi:hypothetical protein